MSLEYVNATPVLRVSDYQRAKAWYMDVLDFKQINEAGDPTPGFGIFRAGSAQIFLHSWDGAGEPWDNWRAYFYVPDMDAMIAHLDACGQAYKGPEVTFYGMREIEVADPDGNILCFGVDAG